MKINTTNMTSDDLINLVMPALVADVKSKAYTTSKVSDAEVLGLIVSKFNKWDREAIFETVIEALTDSNCHQDAEEVSSIQGVQ